MTAEEYRRAADSRIEDATALMERGRSALAHYAAGVAVECMMYAYLCRRGLPIEKHHDLLRNALRAEFFDSLPEDAPTSTGVRAALSEVRLRWLNNHRYRSDDDLLRWLSKEAKLDSGVGQRKKLRYSTSRIIEAALEVVTAGRLAWQRQPHPSRPANSDKSS